MQDLGLDHRRGGEHACFSYPTSLPDPALARAPAVLHLAGHDAKATIWLDGQLVGRWLSDEGWLSRGTWARGIRGMWMNTSPDDFPIDIELLARDRRHVLTVAFEDTSAPNAPAGRIDALALRDALEDRAVSGGAETSVAAPARRAVLRFLHAR